MENNPASSLLSRTCGARRDAVNSIETSDIASRRNRRPKQFPATAIHSQCTQFYRLFSGTRASVLKCPPEGQSNSVVLVSRTPKASPGSMLGNARKRLGVRQSSAAFTSAAQQSDLFFARNRSSRKRIETVSNPASRATSIE